MSNGPGVYVYEDKAGEWRWTLVSANSRKIADSGEGYSSRSGCLQAAETVRQTWADSRLHVHEERPA